jgi:hypothetical protein
VPEVLLYESEITPSSRVRNPARFPASDTTRQKPFRVSLALRSEQKRYSPPRAYRVPEAPDPSVRGDAFRVHQGRVDCAVNRRAASIVTAIRSLDYRLDFCKGYPISSTYPNM